MLQYASKPLVDMGIFIDLEDDSRFYKTLVGVYLRQSPALIREMKIAAAIGDMSKVKSLSACLEATSANVGAVSIEFVSHKLGNIDSRFRPVDIKAIIVHLEKQFIETKFELEKAINGEEMPLAQVG